MLEPSIAVVKRCWVGRLTPLAKLEPTGKLWRENRLSQLLRLSRTQTQATMLKSDITSDSQQSSACAVTGAAEDRHGEVESRLIAKPVRRARCGNRVIERRAN